MVKLRPLHVITGTLHIEGGSSSEVERKREGRKGAVFVTERRVVTEDRQEAAVKVVDVMRKLKKLTAARTPFGVLVHSEKSGSLQDFFVWVTKMSADFNASHKCKLCNYFVCEPLAGARKAALEGWLSRQIKDGNAKVASFLPELLLGEIDSTGKAA